MTRRIIPGAAIGIATALLVLACSDDRSAPGEAPCTVGGHPYAEGEWFKAADGCNDCQCSEKGVSCTMRGCDEPPKGSDPPAGTCTFGDKTYKIGESFPMGDDCNSCTCTGDDIACTGSVCPDPPQPQPSCELQCEDYRYGNCPAGCVQQCVSSSCSDAGACTNDCGGPGSCRCPAGG